MAEPILDALSGVLTRWTMGGSALGAAPPVWHGALGNDPVEGELRLLALSGQFLGTQLLAEPVGDIVARDDLPTLAQPPIADALRPRTRRLLQQCRDAGGRRLLLDFLDSRGCTLHPGDWLPKTGDDVPAVYAPWQDWASDRTVVAEQLSATSWDRFGPAARVAAFADLRRRDPAGAMALLTEKLSGESADHRVRLLETLTTGLSDADRPLLDSLATDRAPRVKALAASLLARLGHGTACGEDAAELAGFYSVQTRGLLRRTKVIVAQPIKTPAQANRRGILFDQLSLDAFAQALTLSPEALAAGWPWGDDIRGDQSLATMAARSAPDTIVLPLADTLAAQGELHSLRLLLPRLDQPQRQAIGAQLLRTNGITFATALTIVGGCGAIDDPLRSTAGTMLIASIGEGDPAPELLALGLLASRDAAVDALRRLAEAGLIASDPRLDMLRLNAALDDRRLPR